MIMLNAIALVTLVLLLAACKIEEGREEDL